MRIDLKSGRAYDTLARAVVNLDPKATESPEVYLVRVYIPGFGEDILFMLPDNQELSGYQFYEDWYEGGDYVELLGFVRVSDINLPNVK